MKPEILEGSRGRRTPSLYQLYLGGGEPSLSWQDRTAFLPVVTDVGTLHRGGDGGTAGQRSSCQQRHTLKSADQNLKDLYPEQSASLGPLLAARCRTPHSRTRRYPSGSLWRTSGCCRTSSPGWSTDLWKSCSINGTKPNQERAHSRIRKHGNSQHVFAWTETLLVNWQLSSEFIQIILKTTMNPRTCCFPVKDHVRLRALRVHELPLHSGV